ncbi:MAG: hypothetical protein LBH53_02210 [Puniceicoccales bacterium]|nr:hypothetical protein [Puniceicoccales bacterium]
MATMQAMAAALMRCPVLCRAVKAKRMAMAEAGEEMKNSFKKLSTTWAMVKPFLFS